MSYSVRFVDEIEDDILATYYWYEKESLGVGQHFLEIFYTQVDMISNMPKLYHKRFQSFRRSLIKHFPHAIYYTTEQDTIVIYGVFHTRKNPQNIKESLDER